MLKISAGIDKCFRYRYRPSPLIKGCPFFQKQPKMGVRHFIKRNFIKLRFQAFLLHYMVQRYPRSMTVALSIVILI